MTESVSVRVDGVEIPDEPLSQLALANYGHFTAMQIRAGRVRGLSLHLSRLKSAHAELYGTDIDTAQILERIREAAEDAPDSYLRITVFESDPGKVRVMTAVRPAVEPAAEGVRLLPVVYQRPVAHIKHVGSFGQLYFGRLARRRGFDDALLTTAGGGISETTTANIAFIDEDGTLVWQSAPSLYGITWQILETALAEAGFKTRRRPVTLNDVSSFSGALVTNSVGVVSVSRIGSVIYNDDAPVHPIAAVYDSSPWDCI
ncbi:aminotransferase class IV [Paenarthrobacter sp. TE4293]|uniref:aminotransferase class IV n=1 Tax=Paenarthrobacter sp. TE4293 TaxID=3381695 RepID=UPI003D2449A1